MTNKKRYPQEMLLMTGCPNCGQEVNRKYAEKVIDKIIDLAIVERDKEIVGMIREFAEPYENSKWLNEVNAQRIINLITNSKK